MAKIISSDKPCKGIHSWSAKVYQEDELGTKKRIYHEQICDKCGSIRHSNIKIVPINTLKPDEGNEGFFGRWFKF